MITFFTIPRAFEGEFDELQRTAIESWKSAVPDCHIILYGDEQGVYEAHKDLEVIRCPGINTNAQGTPLFNHAFEITEGIVNQIEPDCQFLCEISTDIILGADINNVLDVIYNEPRPFVVGQRWDINPGAPSDTATLHPPSGVDYFLYRKGTIGKIPPFAVGRTAYDQWMLWAAIYRWEMTVIDATADLTAIHVNHDYPGFPLGRADIQVSEERRENIRLVRETGCQRWLEITDTPYILENGRIKERQHA